MANDSSKRTTGVTRPKLVGGISRTTAIDAWWTKENRLRRRREAAGIILVVASLCVGAWANNPMLAVWLAVVAVFIKR
jgi:hypothetical protein